MTDKEIIRTLKATSASQQAVIERLKKVHQQSKEYKRQIDVLNRYNRYLLARMDEIKICFCGYVAVLVIIIIILSVLLMMQ